MHKSEAIASLEPLPYHREPKASEIWANKPVICYTDTAIMQYFSFGKHAVFYKLLLFKGFWHIWEAGEEQ